MSVEDERKLFVAGLAQAATEAGLREMFESTGGSVTEIIVPRDRATGTARGFAFVTMGSSDQASRARQQLDGTLVDGRSISVRPFRGDRSSAPRPAPSPQPPPVAEDATLYVGNVPFDCSQGEVEEAFRSAGVRGLQRVHLPTDAEGKPRGFGFLTLESAEAARVAVEQAQNVAIRGRRLSVSIARARGKPQARPAARSPAGAPSYTPPAYATPSYAPEPETSAFPPPPADDRDDGRRGRREKPKKEKKKRGVRGPASDRAPKRKRDEFRSTRSQDYVEDWDDD